MILSEISVRRPVFAMVVSLLLIIVGLMALARLSVREYPDISTPIVSVETQYRGASAVVVESKITRIIENQIAGIEGIEKLTSSSADERSRITIEFSLGRDVESAANDVRDRVARVQQALPEEADAPQIGKMDIGQDQIIAFGVLSDRMDTLQITDYANRYLVDRFSTVDGVAMVRVNGERHYAMRVWLDRNALAARKLTPQDVEDALRSENVELPAGRIESVNREFTLRTNTGLETEDDFRQLVVGRGADGYLVRLGEVAEVKRDAENLRSIARSDGITGISLSVVPTSTANVLATAEASRAMMDSMQAGLPPGMTLSLNVDYSQFIVQSIHEVVVALVIALVLVLIVIYAFLGTVRATLIPAVTIPVSIVAACMVMVGLHFSINVLTLLGAVLAIGLVVDDGIVVLENIVRRIEHGEPTLIAAVDGSKEIGFAVLATTLVLIAVFLPISYIPGNVGRLFSEFGITIAAAVAFSCLVSLTLVPMMASKLFAKGIIRGRFVTVVDRFFRWLSSHYERTLRGATGAPVIVMAVAVGAVLFGAALYRALPTEYAPLEDRGIVQVLVQAPEGASMQYTDRYLVQIEQLLQSEVKRGNIRRMNTRGGGWGSSEVNNGRLFIMLNDWKTRKDSSQDIAQRIRKMTNDLPGVRVTVILPSSMGMRNNARPVQVVLGGGTYEELVRWRDIVLTKAAENPGLVTPDSDYYERKPQLKVSVDRNRAADLGISLTTVGRTLETMMGSRIVTTYLERGEEYNVVLQARDTDRATPNDLNNIYVRAPKSGALVPLSNLVQVAEVAGPVELKRFDRLRSITITAGLAPGYTLGEALDYMEKLIRAELPAEAQINYDGESREFHKTGSALYITFLLALVIAFLVLAAQFESFRHPFIIMMTVPLAVTGALLGLWATGSSINVYSEIGVVMLIGLAAKNGILIVEFANQLRDRGTEFVQATIEAATIRLRPVLMTSFCTVFGALPLLLATGAGAESRRSIGAVIVYGVTFSLVLTLYIVPVLYTLIARNSRSPQYVSKLIDRLRGGKGATPPAEEAHSPVT